MVMLQVVCGLWSSIGNHLPASRARAPLLAWSVGLGEQTENKGTAAGRAGGGAACEQGLGRGVPARELGRPARRGGVGPNTRTALDSCGSESSHVLESVTRVQNVDCVATPEKSAMERGVRMRELQKAFRDDVGAYSETFVVQFARMFAQAGCGGRSDAESALGGAPVSG